MGISNLAIVFAPVLMRCRGDGLSLFSESDRQTDFLIRMIEVIVCVHSFLFLLFFYCCFYFIMYVLFCF